VYTNNETQNSAVLENDITWSNVVGLRVSANPKAISSGGLQILTYCDVVMRSILLIFGDGDEVENPLVCCHYDNVFDRQTCDVKAAYLVGRALHPGEKQYQHVIQCSDYAAAEVGAGGSQGALVPCHVERL
jgi:hypothetical protein